MTNLLIEGTSKTPLIDFLHIGELRIEGKSIPENCFEFYKPVIEWLSVYKKHAPAKITLSVKLDYINTSSSKTILNIFKLLQDISGNSKSDVEIKWYYDKEDEDLHDEGQNYKMFTTLPLTLIPY